jgi:hypothetical protein
MEMRQGAIRIFLEGMRIGRKAPERAETGRTLHLPRDP